MDEDAISRPFIVQPYVHFVRGLPESQLTKRRQRLLFEKILERARGFVRRIDDATFEAIDQGFRRDVHHDNLVGLFDDPIGHSLPDADARDLPDLIVEALEMLKIHRRHHIDAGVQKHHHIFPTLGALGAGDICVRKFIDDTNLRCSAQDRFGIHFFEDDTTVFDPSTRNDLQPFRLLDSVLSAVRLEVADDDIGSLLLKLLRLLEHSIGLSGSSGITKEYLQTAAARRLRLLHAVVLWGKTRTSIPSAKSMRRSTGFPCNRCQKPFLMLCPMKICVMPASRANAMRAFAGSCGPSNTLMVALRPRAIARFFSSAASSSRERLAWRTYATKSSP